MYDDGWAVIVASLSPGSLEAARQRTKATHLLADTTCSGLVEAIDQIGETPAALALHRHDWGLQSANCTRSARICAHGTGLEQLAVDDACKHGAPCAVGNRQAARIVHKDAEVGCELHARDGDVCLPV